MKKVYFVSDFHLGAPDTQKSHEREKKIIQWLDFIKPTAEKIFLLGDIFDFWYEWNNVIPKGFVRFLGKLAELKDYGIEIYFFTVNHDLWAYSYLETEIGIKIIQNPMEIVIQQTKIFLGHGDGLGPKDYKYKILKKIFTNKIAQFFFSKLLHPDFAIWLGKKWSLSRDAYNRDPKFLGEQEWLIQYCREKLKTTTPNYFIFGHRHCQAFFPLTPKTTYINTGVWFKNCPYAELDNGKISLKNFIDYENSCHN